MIFRRGFMARLMRPFFRRNEGREAVGSGRLIVDVSLIFHRDARTGIQRVVRNIWLQLQARRAEGLVAVPVVGTRWGRFLQADIDFMDQPVDVRRARLRPHVAHSGDVFLGLDFSPAIVPRCGRTIRAWKKLGVTLHFVVYDLLPWTRPEMFTPRAGKNYRRWLRFVGIYANSVLCISNDVIAQFRALLASGQVERGRALPAGLMKLASELDDYRSASRHCMPPALTEGKNRPIILMVGTIEPRKRYDFALRIFDRLWACDGPRPMVVIVGKSGWKTEILQQRLREHPLANRDLFWLDAADDGQLAWLYANSSVLLMASCGEGFGLPVLEARSFGLPVIATDLNVFREFGDDDGVVFFGQNDEGEALRLIQKVLARRLPAGALHAASAPNWQEVTDGVLHWIAVNEGDAV